MLFAVDKEGNKTHIKFAIRSQEYWCPCCNKEVILKKGNIRAHHFAHNHGSVCGDSWHYDMSEWHHNWQSQFPFHCQEVVKELRGKKHRADVLIEDKKVVIEFQHSALSLSEFQARNNFYNELGYKVIWVFDAITPFENGQIENYKENLWGWDNYRKTFIGFDCKSKKTEIYLQLEDDTIIKVTWCTSDNGFSRFATDGYYYTEKDIVELSEKTRTIKKKELKLKELYDKLLELYSKNHTTYYFGCPISRTHLCANCNIDIPPNQYAEIMPCMNCDFDCSSIEQKDVICKKRFIDLGLSGDTLVRIESRNKDGFINKISYCLGQKRVYVELPEFIQNISKDVFTLWKENNCSVATFRNVRTGKYIKITKNPIAQMRRYRKVYGYFSMKKDVFSQESVELVGLEKPDWICEWFKEENY